MPNIEDARIEAIFVRSCIGVTAALVVAAALLHQLDVLAARALPLWL